MNFAHFLSRPRRADAGGAVRSVARSHVGRVRAVNEDRTLDRPDRALWAVADGMGGHFGGDVAAETVIAALRRLADGPARPDPRSIAAALQDANRAIHERARAAHGVCGTTVVVAAIDGGIARLVWAGDSRAYLVRAGAAHQLTTDHTLVQEMVDAGTLAAADARRHPNANVVTRALGVEAQIALQRTEVEVRPGDRLLLCSDGLSASLADDDLVDTGQSLADQADALIARALHRDGSDNISLVLIAV